MGLSRTGKQNEPIRMDRLIFLFVRVYAGTVSADLAGTTSCSANAKR
jgi:hypothetical protein